MNHKISAVLLSLMMAGCAYGFYAFFEPYEKTEDLGWDKAALRNPYLAAVYFLQRLDVDARSYDSFEKLQPLPENGAIFVSNSSNVLSARRVDRLIEWVKGGGHLIVAAQPPGSGASDQLLEFFSIENLTTEYRIEVQPKRGSNADTASAGEERKKGSKKLSEQLREYNRKLAEQITKAGSDMEHARIRSAPTTPNSPREIGVGVVMPRAIQPDKASKSNVRQTIWVAMEWCRHLSCDSEHYLVDSGRCQP